MDSKLVPDVSTLGSLPEWETRLSVIVPFRDEGVASWFLPRVQDLCESFPKRPDIEFMIVDSGSIESASRACRQICEASGVTYLYHDSRGSTFAPGLARDYGVRHARGRAVTFLDIDLRVPGDFWDRLLVLMTAYGISRFKKRFFAIPALYLTEAATEEFVSSRAGDAKFTDVYLRWMNGDTAAIQQMAPCSSVGIIDRLHYLSIGGHNPIFRGHGFEDFELYHRLVEEEGRLPRPRDYFHESRDWDSSAYRGFRSRLALLGRPAMLSNLFVVHLWHPRPKALSFYNSAKMATARKVWPDVFKDFDKTRNHPPALAPVEVEGDRTLVLGTPGSDSMRCMRDAYPFLGELIHINEADFTNEHLAFLEREFADLVRHQRITRVLFTNPYGNPKRLNIYRWCRANDVPFLVFERGALPESWFFDEKGFNADSASYRPENWDRSLSAEEDEKVADVIARFTTGHDALEKQGERIGGAALGTKLRVAGQRVLFVPLQRPSDSVMKYLAGAAGDAGRFIQTIDEAARHLKKMGWTVLCKRHPLETASPDLKHARYVPHDTNFMDLLELADAVALVNSGVGLHAMMMGKPCYIFGEAFYQFDGLNTRMETLDPGEISRRITAGGTVDMVRMRRFLHYLTQEFYSFGISRTFQRAEADGSLRTVTTAIDFYQLRLPGFAPVCYEREVWETVPLSAPLLERYKMDLHQERSASTGRDTVVKAAPSQDLDPLPTNCRVLATRSAQEKRQAKRRKLRNDPHAFFRDAKLPLIRPIQHLFSPRPS